MQRVIQRVMELLEVALRIRFSPDLESTSSVTPRDAVTSDSVGAPQDHVKIAETSQTILKNQFPHLGRGVFRCVWPARPRMRKSPEQVRLVLEVRVMIRSRLGHTSYTNTEIDAGS